MPKTLLQVADRAHWRRIDHANRSSGTLHQCRVMTHQLADRMVHEADAQVRVDIDEHLLRYAQRPQAQRADQIPARPKLVRADALGSLPAKAFMVADMSNAFIKMEKELFVARRQALRDVSVAASSWHAHLLLSEVGSATSVPRLFVASAS